MVTSRRHLAPLILLGIWPTVIAAILLLGVIGLGNSLVDVAMFTLIQRSVPDYVLARVFGVIQMLWLGSVGIGAIVAPLLINWLGLDGALIVSGALLIAVLASILPAIRAANLHPVEALRYE